MSHYNSRHNLEQSYFRILAQPHKRTKTVLGYPGKSIQDIQNTQSDTRKPLTELCVFYREIQNCTHEDLHNVS
jgi:hypothetical protein